MTQKPPQGKKSTGCLKGCLLILAIPILLIGVLIFFATLELRRSDEDILKTYQPTTEIAEIAEKNTLTDKGKAVLYRADPKLVDGESFVKYCRIAERKVGSLGCIVSKPGGGPFGGKQIFLLKIDDPKFADHKFSAAVHEMLHIAYLRLSSSKKRQINLLLDQEFSKHQDDFHLMAVVDILKKRKDNDKKDILDELHSKFGVEYSGLLPELEDYYNQYFADREKAVGLFINGGFNSRVRRLDELTYEAKILNNKLTTMHGQLSAYQNAGDMENYNTLVSQFNSMVNQYNTKAVESKTIYNEIQQFYQYFNPNYKLPEEKNL